MTNREIYEAALALLAEEDASLCGDYEARAPYLLAAFCNMCAETDRCYRAARCQDGDPEPQAANCEVALDLDELFPLDDRFNSACACYIAALLIADGNESLSDRLLARSRDELDRVSDEEIPAHSDAIRDIYGFF